MKQQRDTIQPVQVYFAPTWYHSRYGVDFSEPTWQDPIARVERYRELDRLLFDRFGDVGLGSKDPAPAPSCGNAYGHYIAAALFGCHVTFLPDQAPAALPLSDCSFEAMRNFKVPDLATNPVIRRYFAEWKSLKEKYGSCQAGIGIPSPINCAVSVFGEQFLMACALEPETAQHVMRVMVETHFKLYNEVCAVLDPQTYPKTPKIPGGYGNCPAIMFSPRTYREVILPIDKLYRRRVSSFALHHCGIFDAYIDVYQELKPTALDIGGGSNYAAIRQAFPDIPFSLIVNPPDIEGHSADAIDNLIGNMVAGAGPADKISSLWIPEVSQSTADETVRAVRTAHERI